MRKVFYLLALVAMPAMAQQSTISNLEDTGVTFNEKNYWNGGKIGTPEEGDWGEEVYHCSWTSGLITGALDYSVMDYGGYAYDWWGGIALSKSTATKFEVLDDQYNNVKGGGANASATYGVIYGSASLNINVDGGAMVKGLYVTNSAYTHNNFTINTGAYDTKFTAEGDHFYLNIVATKADNSEKTITVKLAEYNAENGLEYVNDWTWVDLSALGSDVTKLTFNFDCNKDKVATYACIDDIEIVSGITGIATFENLLLDSESYWNGIDNKGSFVSGSYLFENGHEVYDYGNGYIYDYCYGFYYTNLTSTTFGGDYKTEQYKSCVGHGVDNSANYATYNVNSWTPKFVEVLGSNDGAVVPGFYITNAASAYTSMTSDDFYGTKKFTKDDWFKLTITGYDAAGEVTGTKDFYLADLRDDKAYIINDWRYVDLSGLGKVKKLGFELSSTDNGDYGMNTPAYFCVDNFGAEGTEELPENNVVITGIQTTNSEASQRAIYDLNGVNRNTIHRGLNIIRMSDGSVRKVVVK